jgi:hypothetical protein
MPIILAIEPDRRQAAHLTALVHRRMKAELLLVPTTEEALHAIGNRVPDLVLVPALLSPQDDAALAAALRVIAAAAHVQLLTIPVLGPPRPAAKSGGVLSALRREKSRSAEPDGCDPAVFADQIASYLDRAAQERKARATELTHDEAPAVVESVAMPPQHDDAPAVAEFAVTSAQYDDASAVAEFAVPRAQHDDVPAVAEFAVMSAQAEQPAEDVSQWSQDEPTGDESVSFALEEVARALFSNAGTAPEAPVEALAAAVEDTTPPASATIVPMVATAAESAVDAEWATVDELIAALQVMPLAAIEATEEDEWLAPVRHPEGVSEEPERVLDEPDPAAWPGLESLAANAPAAPDAAQKVAHGVAKAEAPAPAGRSEQEWVALVESLRHDVERIRTERADQPAPKPAPARSPRPKKAKPVQDEWGLFDPEQCGFAALLAKLEEVTEEEKSV